MVILQLTWDNHRISCNIPRRIDIFQEYQDILHIPIWRLHGHKKVRMDRFEGRKSLREERRGKFTIFYCLNTIVEVEKWISSKL